MKFEIRASILGFVLASLAGCSGSDPAPTVAPPPSPPNLYSQGNLPDQGYWMCRLEYRSFGGRRPFPVAAGESLTLVKQRLERTCARRGDANCDAAARNNQFNCVRAENLGGLNEYPYATACRVSYRYRSRNGIAEGFFASSGANQGFAARTIIDRCLASGRSADCVNAILANQTVCRPLGR